jgi:hypothetical protein
MRTTGARLLRLAGDVTSSRHRGLSRIAFWLRAVAGQQE